MNPTNVQAKAILVEHIALVGGGDDKISVPAGSEWILDQSSTSRQIPKVPSSWTAQGLDVPVATGGWRVASLVGGNEGWVELHQEMQGRAVRVLWDPRQLPYLWYWQERGSPEFPFFERADIQGLEPSSASTADGLGGAIQRGEAWTIEGQSEITVTVEIELLPQLRPTSCDIL